MMMSKNCYSGLMNLILTCEFLHSLNHLLSLSLHTCSYMSEWQILASTGVCQDPFTIKIETMH